MTLISRIGIPLLLMSSSSLLAVEGYEDIYLDRERNVNIHSIYCGTDFNNINALKAAYVYTNSEFIEKGTYHFTSAYGNFSYTFNSFGENDPQQLMSRGTLINGQTEKNKMKKELCIVGQVPGLPNALLKNIGKRTLSVDDPEWNLTMKKYGMFGKPAFGEGVYKDQRSAWNDDAHDKNVYAANQAHIKAFEKQFTREFKKLSSSLPKQFKDAVKYAQQEDGFLNKKVYPVVNAPQVWTPTSKERYNDQMRQLAQEKSWDIVIQKNFDWLFALVGKDNKLSKTHVSAKDSPQWVDGSLQQTAVVVGGFANGKALELEFTHKSAKVDNKLFDSLEAISKQSHLLRNNPIASSKAPRKPVALPKSESLVVYNPAEKVNLFFSPFREKYEGDTYRSY